MLKIRKHFFENVLTKYKHTDILLVDISSTQYLGKEELNMVNTALLEDAIRASGKRKQYLADKIGCTIQSFRMRCVNRYDFKSSDVDILCRELGITRLTDKERIFFAREVDKTSTDKE